ncbi:DNA topoisomerase-3 [Clostridium cavendishii DSM 21758]|uniref:DNA topoisomerase n=1 Tax=Clostridium cavendishii DSM 21758 TaxID=1121302 RepID=A0A1M6NQT3_9CLOT|nr:DNA topoisomerase [Clostridium cavendishii]SHJ98044.1 DNA topoisomerase-3 [Clostridium cavendishii DSM 21758]
MGKALFVTEKPSVAMDFVKLLNVKGTKRDGYIEGDKAVFTWCVGHMVTMCYPEAYDEKLKFWNLKDLPFLPKEYLYDVIPQVKKQFEIVKSLLNRNDIDTIYVCTDSGREGEYIYRLVDKQAGEPNKTKKRIWIDSQTEEEIKRGIKEAKPLSEYDSLAHSAYLRAKEDYLVGINFSRLLTLTYGRQISNFLNNDKVVIAVGRVMSCVLGMVVDREREIRGFQKKNFYKINGEFIKSEDESYEGEWKAIEGTRYYNSSLLYNDTGFNKEQDARNLISYIKPAEFAVVESVKKTKETKNAPLLFNLAELQNECTKRFKISPDETLGFIQKLYEKKLLTYPRTDARVLSTAVAKNIGSNISKLVKMNFNQNVTNYSNEILKNSWQKNILKSKYVDDSKITDHYAIIPTGEGQSSVNSLGKLERAIYDLVVTRFLAIFYPPAKYSKVAIVTNVMDERFMTSKKVCVEKGYLEILKNDVKDKDSEEDAAAFLSKLRKGEKLQIGEYRIKEGETTPPKRYTTGSIIIAMENAGKLIEDDELREHIKGQGIGTSATRAEIIKKLINIGYLGANSKSQILTPTEKGEMIYEAIKVSVPSLLNPTLTASWEKGLKLVYEKAIEPDNFMEKLEYYTKNNINRVMVENNLGYLNRRLFEVRKVYNVDIS